MDERVNKQRGWRLAIKRAIDVTVAGAGLLVVAPVLAAGACAVRASMGSPVMFKQQRPGRYGRAFVIRKFRTMTDARDATGKLLPDAERLTAVGRIIRASSIDELPQLWNVIVGDMSLVGPRPLMMQYLDRYSAEQSRRHDVLPGITGWAQVNGRNQITWEAKFGFDVWYADRWSLMLDAKILARTALSVLRRDGISSEGHMTMPEFMGTSSVWVPAAAGAGVR